MSSEFYKMLLGTPAFKHIPQAAKNSINGALSSNSWVSLSMICLHFWHAVFCKKYRHCYFCLNLLHEGQRRACFSSAASPAWHKKKKRELGKMWNIISTQMDGVSPMEFRYCMSNTVVLKEESIHFLKTFLIPICVMVDASHKLFALCAKELIQIYRHLSGSYLQTETFSKSVSCLLGSNSINISFLHFHSCLAWC